MCTFCFNKINNKDFFVATTQQDINKDDKYDEHMKLIKNNCYIVIVIIIIRFTIIMIECINNSKL